MVSKFLSKYYPYSKALQLRKDILNFQQLPTETVFEAWEKFESCLRKCPKHRILLLHQILTFYHEITIRKCLDHRIFLLQQILTFYHGITMIEHDKIMVATGGNIMQKTPQEAYDLIENVTQHHYQCDSEVQYDTTTDMTAHYSKTTFASNLPPQELNNDYEGDILFLEKLLDDEPSEAKKSEIDPLIKELHDTFLIGDTGINFNPLKGIDEPVPIPRASEKPLDSLDLIFKTFKMTIIIPLFDFDSEFTLNSDNPIFDIQNEESDIKNRLVQKQMASGKDFSNLMMADSLPKTIWFLTHHASQKRVG
nr:hypothetical protein [Tanacetum cinerariifolium]